MINIEWQDPLENGKSLSHFGNKNSGRYPKGSGDRPYQHVSWRQRRKQRKQAAKDLEDYVNSPEFLNGKYSEYKAKKNGNGLATSNKGSNELVIKKPESESNDPNWRYADVKFKKPKPRLGEGTLNGEVQDSNNKKEKNNKKQEYINAKPVKDKEEIPTIDYQQPVKEKQKKDPMSSQDTAKAASYFKGASSLTGEVSKGVDKAWGALHDLKYGNEDRSKNVRGLTNEELRRTIERIKLDQEYNKLTMPPKSQGYDRTMAALGALGSVMAVTATGLTVAAGFKKLRES